MPNPHVFALPEAAANSVAQKILRGGCATKIRHDPTGPGGSCYANVAQRVEALGGLAAHGWLLLHWPGAYIEAMHHCIWKDEAGELVDITERPYFPDELGYSMVILDESIEVATTQPLIRNRYLLTPDFMDIGLKIQNTSHLVSDTSRALVQLGALVRAGHKFRNPAQVEVIFRQGYSEIAELRKRFDVLYGDLAIRQGLLQK